MYDVARSIMGEMKSADKRTVTIELLSQALENKKFGFLTGTLPPLTQRNDRV